MNFLKCKNSKLIINITKKQSLQPKSKGYIITKMPDYSTSVPLYSKQHGREQLGVEPRCCRKKPSFESLLNAVLFTTIILYYIIL